MSRYARALVSCLSISDVCRKLVAASLVALLLFSQASAQTATSVLDDAKSSIPGDQTYKIHQSVREVLLYCTVFDHSGHLITDLEKEDFSVRDSGTVAAVKSFRHQDDPISLGLVVDSSGSMSLKREAVAAAALELIRASNPVDEAFVLNFTNQPYLDQDFTSDLDKLRKGLSQGQGPGGQTALYDTLIYAADHLAKQGRNPKQAIVVVTDGEDNASLATLEQAIRRVQLTSGPVVYAIGLLYDTGGGAAHRSRNALQSLADETGGIAFFPRSLTEVEPIAKEVARDIRSQYRLSFDPLILPSSRPCHTIDVEAHRPGSKLKVRTRKGYLFPPLPSVPQSVSK